MAQSVEHIHGKDGVVGSIPTNSSINLGTYSSGYKRLHSKCSRPLFVVREFESLRPRQLFTIEQVFLLNSYNWKKQK